MKIWVFAIGLLLLILFIIKLTRVRDVYCYKQLIYQPNFQLKNQQDLDKNLLFEKECIEKTGLLEAFNKVYIYPRLDYGKQ